MWTVVRKDNRGHADGPRALAHDHTTGHLWMTRNMLTWLNGLNNPSVYCASVRLMLEGSWVPREQEALGAEDAR